MSEASPVMLYVPSQPVAKIEAKIAQVLLMIYIPLEQNCCAQK